MRASAFHGSEAGKTYPALLDKSDMKTAMFRWLLLVSFVCFHAMSSAQMSRMYTTQNNLPTSDIYDIYVDEKGWAWVSGVSSMSLFDGTNFYNLMKKGQDIRVPVLNTVRGVRDAGDACMWVYSSNGLYKYHLLTNKFEHVMLSENEDSVKGMSMHCFIDYPKDGYKLIGTDEYGILLFDTKSCKVDKALTDRLCKVIDDKMCTEAMIDSRGCLWAVCNTVRRVNLKVMKDVGLPMESQAARVLKEHRVEDIDELEQAGKMLLATDGGLLIYDRGEDMLRTLRGGHIDMPISVVYVTRSGRVLVGSDGYGIWQLDAKSEVLEPLSVYDPNMNLAFAKVKAIAEDGMGNMLFGLLQKGVMVTTYTEDNFRYYALSPTDNRMNAVAVSALTWDERVGYVMATDGCGVFVSRDGNLSNARHLADGLRSALVQTLQVDAAGRVWAGSYGGGVEYLDMNSGHFVTPDWLNGISNDYIMTLGYDKSRNWLYAGSNGRGVYRIDLDSHKVDNLLTLRYFNPWVSALFDDYDGSLWIGTGEGVFVYDPNDESLNEVKFPESNIVTVHCITRMGSILLVATNNGLVCYDPDTKQSVRLLDNQFIKSVEVLGNDIWLTTERAVICVEQILTEKGLPDPDVVTTRCYTSFGGSFLGEFHGSSHTQAEGKMVLFGGDNGIISFNADAMKQHRKLTADIFFTRLLVNGRERNYNPDLRRNVMDASIGSATEINLPDGDNSLRVYFSVPDFSSADRINYQYKLDGFDKVWKSAGTIGEIYYPNLPSGKYTLTVRAYYENNEQEYKEKSIRICIAQPWYNTVWAWMIYTIIVLSLAYFIYRIQHERSRQRNLLTRARHNEQLKDAKLRMFTSIAHELRTPLTMILSPLRQLQASTDDEQLLSLYDVMNRNCNRLLAVVKQITDIRKIDNGQFHLHFSEVNFADYCEYICSSFTAYASAKQITFTIEHLNQNVTVWLDTIHFEKILTNILSNAFKFTPSGGRIILRTKCILKDSNDWFEIRIYNSGSKIDVKDIPHIFERFYQANTDNINAGSGIGLNLVNELVNLHHGTIEAHNIDPDGVEFVMNFPLGSAHLSEEELLPRQVIADNDREQDDDIFADISPMGITDNDTEGDGTRNKYSILVVDDEDDLCQFVKSQLQDDYNILIANSGNTAWQEILKSRPDVVVTDIRMPDGNGIELCKRIKGNPETDNIPIIMLTSENSDRAQINSLNLQVDHFLSKPFNVLMLKGAIAQSLRLREQMKSRIRRTEVGFDYSQSTIDSVDDQLFARVNAILKKNLDDSTFGVSELAEQAGISRVHLNRKMKERYGMSPVNFIRSYRLKQAAYFLVNNNVNISEVAYRVGFSSHSHFSNSFREFFGMTPKEFITYYAENEDDETLQKLLE